MSECPYCQSEEFESLLKGKKLRCLKCSGWWNPDLLWIHEGLKYFFINIGNLYKGLSEPEKKHIELLCRSAAQKLRSSGRIKDDDIKSSMILLLISMEEMSEAITKSLSNNLPKSFEHVHEVKLTPYYTNSPDPREKDGKIYLALDISGKKRISRKIRTEEEFFRINQKLEWKFPAEKYGVMFKHGRYFRSEKWEEFLEKELPKIAQLISDLGKFAIYLQERKDHPSGMPGWIFTKNDIIPLIPLEELHHLWNKMMKERKSKTN